LNLWNSYRIGCALQFCYCENGGFLDASVKFKPLLIVSQDNGFVSEPLGLFLTPTLDDVLDGVIGLQPMLWVGLSTW